MGKLVVVGDVHGNIKHLNKAIKTAKSEIESKEDYVVFLGDYVDRGHNNIEVVNRLIEFKKECNVIYLKGNHDYEFVDNVDFFSKPYNLFSKTVNNLLIRVMYNRLSFILSYQTEIFNEVIDYVEDYYNVNHVLDRYDLSKVRYNLNEGAEELNHRLNMGAVKVSELAKIVNDFKFLCEFVKNELSHIYNFLKNTIDYVETDKYVISHSGGNKTDKLEDNTTRDWVWSRMYIKGIHTDKVFIVGHTPTQSGEVEINNRVNHVFVDTGAIFRDIDIGIYITEYEWLKEYDTFGEIYEGR